MSAWLDSTRQALAEAAEPVRFFIRDDDVGWADAQLFAVLDLFADVDLPIDLAVIPRAMTARLLSRKLRCGRGNGKPEKPAPSQSSTFCSALVEP